MAEKDTFLTADSVSWNVVAWCWPQQKIPVPDTDELLIPAKVILHTTNWLEGTL